MNLVDKINSWNQNYENENESDYYDSSSVDRRPYDKIFAELRSAESLCYTPYQNDQNPNYLEKLDSWLENFPQKDQHYAFLLATKVIFITMEQLEYLQGVLYEHHIKMKLLEDIIEIKQLKLHQHYKALHELDSEMDKTLFVPNSDSAPFNSFVHINKNYFSNREGRFLVGGDADLWTYAGEKRYYLKQKLRSCDTNSKKEILKKINIIDSYEKEIICGDPHIKNKKRLIILEDFSGSGSDLIERLIKIHRSNLPFEKVILATCMATKLAYDNVMKECDYMNKELGKLRYTFISAFILPKKCSCINRLENSEQELYLDGDPPVKNLSVHVKRLSEDAFANHFKNHLDKENALGFRQSLAFVFYTNCPDNTLPIIWKQTKNWRALFPRSSRII